MAAYQFTPYSLVQFITTVIALVMATVTWQRRAVPGARYVIWLELAVAEWSMSIAFEIAAVGIPLKTLWSQIAYLGTTTTPIFYFLFARTYAHPHKKLSNQALIGLFTIPAIILLIAATNNWHHCLWTDIQLDAAQNLAIYGHGFCFWIFIAYTYTLLVISTVSLYLTRLRTPVFYRSQTTTLLIGALIPITSNVIYISGLNPIPGMDWTPVSFAATGIVLGWGIFRHRIFNLVPIARTQLIENMLDGILVLDAHNCIVDINPAAQDMLGSIRDLKIGQAIDEILTTWQGHTYNGVTTAEVAVEQPNPRALDIRISPLDDRQGNILGCLVVLRDITERKQMEQALQELNETLEAQVASRTAEIRAQKERAEAILQNVDNAITLLDQEMQIQYANRAFTKITGYTTQEVLGKQASSVGAGAISEAARQTIESHLAEGAAWHGEVKGQKKNGSRYEADLSVIPLRGDDGEVTGYVSSHRDISQHKALEHLRSQFMNNVSHELRTPLTSIKLYAHLLQTGDHPDRQARYLQQLGKEIARLEELTEDILELTALDSGRVQFIWEAVSLPQLVNTVARSYQKQATASGIKLVTAPPPSDLSTVKGDRSRLLQALGELVENAITFTPADGEIIISVSMHAKDQQQWGLISIQDTGPGISIEEQERIFDRFYRGTLAESGHVPGTGLGLNIVQAILRAHNGWVTVKSSPGQGSTFTLWLPVS